MINLSPFDFTPNLLIYFVFYSFVIYLFYMFNDFLMLFLDLMYVLQTGKGLRRKGLTVEALTPEALLP